MNSVAVNWVYLLILEKMDRKVKGVVFCSSRNWTRAKSCEKKSNFLCIWRYSRKFPIFSLLL